MDDLRARVMRLQRAAWTVRRAAGTPCRLPFALILMTDEDAQPDPAAVIERLPRVPALVVFRHYRTPRRERVRLAAAAQRAARSGGHGFVVAGGGGDGGHNARGHGRPRLVTVSVHDLGEPVRKRSLGADLALVSPVFPTTSHPAVPGLGPARAAALAARLPMPAFALGGVTPATARGLIGTPFRGIATLSGWRDGG